MPTDETPATRCAVVVVGSITADVTAIATHMPAQGETVLGDGLTLALGGKGANQAVAAARAGVRVHLVGCIGNDVFGDFVSDALRDNGVEAAEVQVRADRTGIAHIRVDATGENNIVMVPLANAALTQEHVIAALDRLQASASVLLTQLEIDPAVCQAAIEHAKQAGFQVVLDPAPAIPVPDELWGLVDVVTPNETEAARYTGVEVVDADSASAAGKWFCDRGTPHALITLAGQGAVLVTSRSVTEFPAFVVPVVDSTAAGDAFTGYLGAALARGLTVVEAVPHALAAGALAVTKAGASPSIPSFDDVDAMLSAASR